MIKINKSKTKIEPILILPDIRSAINIGSIFRTADAVGISKIYLTGHTPRPSDKFDRIQKDIAKAALGAETWVAWEYKEKLAPLIVSLKKKGFTMIAIEQDPQAIDYRKISALLKSKNVDKVAFILGSEVEGVDKKILDKCDLIAFIPMAGKKESLNVSVACGVALFRILRS
ncbi:MAG: TrmH family RNA methyltransferase [bacterium]